MFRCEVGRMQASVALGSSCFLPNYPCLAKSKILLPRPHCSLRNQKRTDLRTTWPTVSLSLFGSGFFLGPLIDGLHSRVNLVVYETGSINIGPLHTNIWVTRVSERLFPPSCFANLKSLPSSSFSPPFTF